MSAVRLFAACSPGEVRVAAVDDLGLLDYALWRPGTPDGLGDLYRGCMGARMRAMAGAFVHLGTGADGFLPDSEGTDGRSEGESIGVRVVRTPQGGKGPRLSARLRPDEQALIGSGPPGLLRRGEGALARLAALHPEAPVLVDDAAVAASLRPGLGERLCLAPAAFDAALAGAVAALAEPVADVPGGARLSIHPTPALTAIDIDLGAGSAAREGKARSQLAANLALLPLLARQIRLRNLGGAILVDFAGMAAGKRPRLAPALTTALAEDPLKPRLLGFTALGFAEIVRSRRAAPLSEMLQGPLATALAALRAADAEARANPARRVGLVVGLPVAGALRADAVALQDWRRRQGYDLPLRADPTLPALGWRIEV